MLRATHSGASLYRVINLCTFHKAVKVAKGKKGGKGRFFKNLLSDASLLFWRIFTIIISILTLFIILRSAWSIIKSYREINKLHARQRLYQEQITADSTLIEQLKFDEYLEKYARERYNMQRPNEKVYLIEK